VVDSHGTVHGTFISFPYTTGAEVRQLTFLRFSGDTLIMGSVEGTTGVSSHSIAVDQDDCLHMLATVPGEVRYFTGNQDAWSFVTVEGVSSDYCSILVDSEGTVHALYYDTTNVMLKHATLIGGSWSIEALDELHSVDSATLDSDGCVHGCYCSDEGALVYFSNSSGAWESETIDANCIVQMWSASVAVLDGGTRTITYCDELNDNLKMARRGDGEWYVSVLASDAGYSSMAVDSLNNVVVSYISGGSVYFMRIDESGGRMWLSLQSGTQLGTPTAIAADAGGYVHVLYSFSHTSSDPLSMFEEDCLVYATNSRNVPRGPSVLSLSQERDGLRLTWNADGSESSSYDVDGYRIYRGYREGEESLLASVGAGQLEYLDEDVDENLTYYYRVTAHNDDGESLMEYSAQADTADWDWETGVSMSMSDYGLIVAIAVIVLLVALLVMQRNRHRPERISEETVTSEVQ
jgi:hypothetical protein